MKSIIQTDNAPNAIGPYSQAVWAGNLLFLSGQIALNPFSGEMENSSLVEETTRVLENIKAILKEANLDFTNIVKVSIFLKDMNTFEEINTIYSTYFTKPYPARETIEVSRLPKDARVEISIIANQF